jgi:hypothetical protein
MLKIFYKAKFEMDHLLVVRIPRVIYQVFEAQIPYMVDQFDSEVLEV